MKLVAKYGKYELFVNEKGIYFHCYCGGWQICGYERNEPEAVARFAKRLGVTVEEVALCGTFMTSY